MGIKKFNNLNLSMIDIINGFFEIIGGIVGILNIKSIIKDKEVKGVSYFVTLFFSSWGIWNCYFYFSLNLFLSLLGSFIMTIVNIVWLILVFKYKNYGFKSCNL